MVPKFFDVRKVSGEVPGFESKEEFNTIVAAMQKSLAIFENDLAQKKYFGGEISV